MKSKITIAVIGVVAIAGACAWWFWPEDPPEIQFDSYAQKEIGVMYENGVGVKRDPDMAAKWYRKAAASKDENEQFFLVLNNRKDKQDASADTRRESSESKQ